MNRTEDFPQITQQQALQRQKNKCASCGTRIYAIGNGARSLHAFGEGAHAHHMLPVRLGGTAALSNCVILCQSCHYNAHEGGNYRFGTVVGRPEDFRFFQGKKGLGR